MGQLRKRFGKIADALTTPHLLELQTDSYKRFLQLEEAPASRGDYGLEGVFRSVFPIEDFNKTASLEYVSYEIGMHLQGPDVRGSHPHQGPARGL